MTYLTDELEGIIGFALGGAADVVVEIVGRHNRCRERMNGKSCKREKDVTQTVKSDDNGETNG